MIRFSPYRFVPKINPLSPRRSAVVCILDIGSSKTVCLILRLSPLRTQNNFFNRTHYVKVMGIGHVRSEGLKSGCIIDMTKAERTIRKALGLAETMANVEIKSVILGISAGNLSSESYQAEVDMIGRKIEDSDIKRVLGATSSYSLPQERSILHTLPINYSLDAITDIKDPKGMLGRKFGVNMHITTTDLTVAKNLILCVERCQVSVDGMIASPFAAGLSVLTKDEAEMGAVVVDMGAGTTTVAVFSNNQFIHADGINLGGDHITKDIAKGLSIGLHQAERLKILQGASFSSKSDDYEILTIPVSDEDGNGSYKIVRSQLIHIIRPRIDEIIEILRHRLRSAGFFYQQDFQIILTGGASMLPGLVDCFSQTTRYRTRLGKPAGIDDLPETKQGPDFSTAIGLGIYPQLSGIENFKPDWGFLNASHNNSYFSQLGQWLKQGFC